MFPCMLFIDIFDEHYSFSDFCCLRLRKYNLRHRVCKTGARAGAQHGACISGPVSCFVGSSWNSSELVGTRRRSGTLPRLKRTQGMHISSWHSSDKFPRLQIAFACSCFLF